MDADQLRVLAAKAYTDRLGIANTLEYLRHSHDPQAKLIADYEGVLHGLDAILADIDEQIKAVEVHA
mgnify:CR=1